MDRGRERPRVDLGTLGAAAIREWLPRARAVLTRQSEGLEMDRPPACAMPSDDAALRVLPEGAAHAEALADSRRALCRTTPALAEDRREHAARVARARHYLDRLEAATRR